MTDNPFNIPAGATQLPDISRFTPDERRKALAEAMREIRFHGSPADVREFQEQYPETKDWLTKSTVTVSVPKPPGFYDAIDRMVGGWLTSPDALRQTNRADVEALNANFGGKRFNPANFLNRTLTAWQRERIGGLFEQRGYRLPDAATSLAKVKHAAKAAQAGTLPDATAFGTIGTLAGGKLTIGGKAFSVVTSLGHDYVRFHCGGKEARFRLDLLTDFLRQCGLLFGQPAVSPSTPMYRSIEGETVLDRAEGHGLPGETVLCQSPLPSTEVPAERLPGETVFAGEQDQLHQPSLSERIERLAANLRR